jgi:hypothetical protein
MVLAGLGALAMLAVLIYGFTVGDFGAEGRQLLSMPWGVVSLVDLYVGFVLFSVWIILRDGLSIRSLVWVAGVMILGSLTISVYVLYALAGSRGRWDRFFLGRRAPSPS